MTLSSVQGTQTRQSNRSVSAWAFQECSILTVLSSRSEPAKWTLLTLKLHLCLSSESCWLQTRGKGRSQVVCLFSFWNSWSFQWNTQMYNGIHGEWPVFGILIPSWSLPHQIQSHFLPLTSLPLKFVQSGKCIPESRWFSSHWFPKGWCFSWWFCTCNSYKNPSIQCILHSLPKPSISS